MPNHTQKTSVFPAILQKTIWYHWGTVDTRQNQIYLPIPNNRKLDTDSPKSTVWPQKVQ